MKQWKLKSGCTVSQVLSGPANAYLIHDGDAWHLVDTGRSIVLNKLQSAIEKMKGSQALSSLILTHTHYDHCQNASAIQEKEKCRIIVSALAKNSIRNGYTPLPSGTNIFTDLFVRMGRKTGWTRFRYEPFTGDELVVKELNIDTSETKIRIIETPGHSADSISVIIDNDIAIVGDAMFGISKRSVMPPFADDPTMMIKSWRKLLDTGCNKFLPGHGREVERELLAGSYGRYAAKYGLSDVGP
jgi:glyoxylase-like metal-dependent hydrolase (beta-lactamase superfamily II)